MDVVSPQRKPYDGLAAIYDFVMRHVDYVEWSCYVHKLLVKFGNKPQSLVDLACGTGNNTLEFSKLGYKVTGVDRSGAMVDIAQSKAHSIDQTVHFATGDLRKLVNIGPFDAATCLYDSFNYLMTPSDVYTALESIASILKPNGVFVFDVCTERNSIDHFKDVRGAEEGPGFSYTRHSYYDEKQKIQFNSFDITCDDLHFCETHKQHIYRFEDMIDMIAVSPFKSVATYDGFSMRRGSELSNRIHFVLQLCT